MRGSLQSVPVRLALLIAAVGLGSWQAARLADRLWPEERARGAAPPAIAARTRPEERRGTDVGTAFPAARLAPERSLPSLDGRSAPPAGGPAQASDGGAVEPGSEEERAAAAPLADAMKRLVRDIEFNAGLPEPLQQVVVPPPAPWRPDPAAEARPAPVIEEIEPRAGSATGGARVTIRGRHLRPSQVMFGLDPARIVGAGPEAVTVEAPPSRAGPVAIAVTNDDGSYAVAPVPFTYGK